MSAAPGITIRPAGQADNDAIWALYRQAMHVHIERIWGWDETWQRNDFAAAMANVATRIVEVEGALGGYYQVDRRGQDDYLRMLILAPEVRGQGIGAAVLASVLDASMAAGRGLQLRVFKVNPDAMRFYLRQGWQMLAEEEHAFRMVPALTPSARDT
jgi:GNAT superfamily N-acetyltransferase